MKSFLRLGSCLSLLLAGLVFAGTAPAAADTLLESGQTLPLSSYAAHLVDESRGRIYVTAGPGDQRLVVTDLTGHPVQTVGGLPGASSMALSDDGTSLFVALETHRVVRLNAETLEVAETYQLPNFQTAVDLAWAGDRLWVVARPSCCADDVFSLNPATGERTPLTGLQGSSFLLTSTATGRLVVLMRSTNEVSSVDPRNHAVLATRGFADWASSLLTARTGQPYVVTENGLGLDHLVLLDPDTLATVRSTQVTSGLGVAMDGTIAVSSSGSGWDNSFGVDVRDPDTSTRLNRYRLSAVPWDRYPQVRATVLTSAGLVVIHKAAETIAASFVSDPSAQSTTLSVDPPPPDAFVGRQTILTGTLTDQGAPIAGAEVRIVDEPAESNHGQPVRTRTATTAEDGTFAFPYTARSYLDVLTFEYAGDDLHPAAWQQVYGQFDLQPTNLSLDWPRTPAPSEPITITGTLTALGEPIPDAELEVEQWCSDGVQPYVVRTDGAGRLALTVTPGRCRTDQVSFYYDGTSAYDRLWRAAYVEPTWQTSATTLVQPVENAVVGSTFTWTGKVAKDGVAAPDLPVSYTISRGSFPTTNVAAGTTRTDASGAFTIAETIESGGGYTLLVRYEGDASTLGSGAADDFVVTRVPIQLSVDDMAIEALPDQEVTIGGRVTTTDGTGLADHLIEISHDGSVTALRTDAVGRFAFRTVPTPPTGGWDSTKYYGIRVLETSTYAAAAAGVAVKVAPEPTRVILDNVPSTTVAGEAVTLGGRLLTGGGEPLADRTVVMTHRDDVEKTFEVLTDAQGRFSVDTVIETGRGQVLTARFAGTRLLAPSDTSTSWRSFALPGVLTLEEVSPRLVGESITLRGRLSDTEGVGWPSWINLSLGKDTGQTEWSYDSFATATDGSFSWTVPADAVGRYTFTAHSALGRLAAQSESIVVEVRPLRLTTAALQPDAVRRGWSIYDASRDPAVRSATNPARRGLCVAHEVERLVDGAWRDVRTSECRDTGAAGTLREVIDIRHPAGSRFRVRAVRDFATATVGSWTRLRFR